MLVSLSQPSLRQCAIALRQTRYSEVGRYRFGWEIEVNLKITICYPCYVLAEVLRSNLSIRHCRYQQSINKY